MFDDDEKTPDQELTNDEATDAASYDESEEAAAAGNGYKPHNDDDATDDKIHHLGGMYQNWFLDYASYVILERAVPSSTVRATGAISSRAIRQLPHVTSRHAFRNLR